MAQTEKNMPARQETWVPSLNQEDPLDKGMATHSSILARRIPWTEELGGLQSMGWQKVRQDGATNTFTFNPQAALRLDAEAESRKERAGTSLAVQWLRLYTPNAQGMGSIPGWGTRVSHAAWCGQKREGWQLEP